MKTEPVAIPRTPRLDALALEWQRRGARPAYAMAPGPSQESVWDYPRPPAVERVHERVTVSFADCLVADSVRALRVCETGSPPTYYVPAADVRRERLVPAPGRSLCEWKGEASYLSIRVGSELAYQAAWTYAAPCAEYAILRGHLGFYPGRVDRCSVGGRVVRAQDSDFYAGWITPELVGPFTGDPGTFDGAASTR